MTPARATTEATGIGGVFRQNADVRQTGAAIG